MNDVFGQALRDFYDNSDPAPLYLYNNYGSREEMPVEIFFRDPEDFPELEHLALAFCDGKILDVGAGAGSHALALQNMNQEVYALEINPVACEIMKERGVTNIIQHDFFSYTGEKFDTLLFMMNGIGLAGRLERVIEILEHAKTLLNPGGQLIFDTSDISYLYKDGKVEKPKTGYFGEVGFQYEYKGQLGQPFGWVYIDQNTLGSIGRIHGWAVQILFEDGEDQYLVRMEQVLPENLENFRKIGENNE